ncbi:hypothetical protein [Parabacteroides goldsteinii]|uniref:hypothetical protein n=1 Tax=Parabacteroides goldsteinii TaxID=328812 RepID=UPI002593F048|nr:hypothetical protein [Parabacteroides goldsteinii]
MKREILLLDENGTLLVPTDTNCIAMTEYEIAELFGIIAPTVRAAIKAVYRSGVIREEDARRYLRMANGTGIEVYDIEMILTLAFRIDSFGADKVREYLFRTLRANRRSAVHLLLTCSRNAGTTAPN